MIPSAPPRAEVRVEIVRPEGLAEIEGEWAALWTRCPAASPFGAPAWALSWARHFAPGRCGAVALRADGRLVGLVPVFCWNGALLLAGTGPSDRGEALLEPGFEAEAGRLLAALPLAAPEPFERIDLQQLGAESPLWLAPLPAGWREERGAGEPCLVAPLVGEGGLGAVSGRQRAHWRKSLRMLEREGGTAGLVAPAEVGAAVGDLLRLNGLRWGAAGVLADPLMERLLREAGPALAAAGLLRLWEVRVGAGRIAALMVLAGRGAHHGYNGGFDPGWARISPAAILVGLAMEGAAAEGAGRFDFLRGGEGYKRVWGAAPVAMGRRVIRPG
ncbi:GNAT family N-acetyltransferase [Rubellimicrobium aerolatum]|uniref:GNAT family N-acetyltransferase n=1 Tax=Rubellimicrobium aerolatum TaxID=490979 RepID=A0ABW0SGK9_9RHOB|nr:GNAT family N-acetyltransferase [Rubellimicrobium aerolatum]MBP1807415.1 CelD/BcsL family acetyltransferase involved in cellulose biosynthesis [Rubellimicrobium aerolatum]